MLYTDDDDDDFDASKTCNELRMKQNTPNWNWKIVKMNTIVIVNVINEMNVYIKHSTEQTMRCVVELVFR